MSCREWQFDLDMENPFMQNAHVYEISHKCQQTELDNGVDVR